MNLLGTLEQIEHGEPLSFGVAGSYEAYDLPQGRKGWGGRLVLASTAKLFACISYRVTMNDGRTARVRVRGVRPGPDGFLVVDFDGLGEPP